MFNNCNLGTPTNNRPFNQNRRGSAGDAPFEPTTKGNIFAQTQEDNVKFLVNLAIREKFPNIDKIQNTTVTKDNNAVKRNFTVQTKLDDTNYPSWSFMMQRSLKGCNLWYRVTKEDPVTAEDTDPRGDEEAAFVAIARNIEFEQMILIQDLETAYDAWEALKNHHLRAGLDRETTLRAELSNLRMDITEPVGPFLTKYKTLISTLNSIGATIEPATAAVQLLVALPVFYVPLRMALKLLPRESLRISAIEVMLLDMENARQEYVNAGGYTAHYAGGKQQNDRSRQQSRPQRKQPYAVCPNCNKPALHKPERCWSLPQNAHLRPGASSVSVPTTTTHAAHFAEAEQTHFVLICDVYNSTNINDWILDSGATAHMTGDMSLIYKYKPTDHSHVTIASGATFIAKGTGKSLIKSNGNTIELDVIYVDGLSKNLMSLCRLLSDGRTFECTERHATLKQGNKVIFSAPRRGALYVLINEQSVFLARQSAPVGTTMTTWHRRLGHVNLTDIRKLKEGLATGLEITDPKTDYGIYHCSSCLLAKHHREPKNHHASTHAERPLGRVHSDIAGPITPAGRGGYRYILTFIDEYTRYAAIYLLKGKSANEVNRCLKEFITKAERQNGNKMLILRTDGGSEYKDLVRDQLKTLGIIHEITNPYTPHQNGLAERYNRTVFEAVRAMLADQKCRRDLWADAAVYAAEIRNSLPTRSLERTPYEMWTGVSPNVTTFRVFGCTAYTHVPDSKRTKLDDKSVANIFIGFEVGTKGWKFLNAKTGRVFTSKDAVFLEAIDQIPESTDNHTLTLPWDHCDNMPSNYDDDTEASKPMVLSLYSEIVTYSHKEP